MFALGLLLAVPATQAVAAGPAYEADLGVSAPVLHGRVGATVTETWHFINLGPSNTLTGDVVFDVTAPGGTVFIGNPARFPWCHWITADTHYSCYSSGQFWVSSGEARSTLQIKIDSAKVTPGRIAISCACDPNLKNNVAVLNVVVDGLPPSPKPSQSPKPHHSATPKPTKAHASPTVRHTTPPASPPPAPAVRAGSSSPDAGPSSSAPAVAPTAASSAAMVNSASSSSTGAGTGIYVGAGIAALLILAAIPIVYRRRAHGLAAAGGAPAWNATTQELKTVRPPSP